MIIAFENKEEWWGSALIITWEIDYTNSY